MGPTSCWISTKCSWSMSRWSVSWLAAKRMGWSYATARATSGNGWGGSDRENLWTTSTRSHDAVPMIDVYAPAGTFRDRAKLARDLATAMMTIERVPNIPLFRQNTAAFVHELPPD